MLLSHMKEHANTQQMINHRPLAELDLLDDTREQQAKVRACTRLGDCAIKLSVALFLIVLLMPY